MSLEQANDSPNEGVSPNGITENEQAVKKTPIGGFESIEEFTKDGFKEIVEAARVVNSFPQGASRDLYCSYPSFGNIIDQQSDRILGIVSKVLKWQHVRGNIERRQKDERFDMLLECNDAILEQLNSNLDELEGVKRNSQTIIIETQINTATVTPSISKSAGSWNIRKNVPNAPLAARLITAKNIARPQLKFRIPVDNSAATPFIPKLKDKPNSIKPLAILPEYDDAGNEISYLHPYEFELMKFEVPASQLKRKSPEKPIPLSQTELVYVDTVAKLNEALEELRQHTEIAIDVEHHSYRTFLGFTCLVQMSTRTKDYIFDALALRDDMHVLNEVLTDPRVVKILHGADLDIIWLQRDLSLYIVNMFDTHQAAKALDYARLSLSYLLKHYCDIEADKTFQLADWRMRPLPQELINYARQDTHFLIYIYESLTNALLDAGNQKSQLLRVIYQHSTELCMRRYVKPVVTPVSHLDFIRKSARIFDNRQMFALREIYIWRDGLARKDDESIGYVLPNHMLMQIADSLPREMQGILACCNPIPPLVRQNLHSLHQIVLRARSQPLVKPIVETEAVPRDTNSIVKDYNSKLYCPHDLSHSEALHDNLQTLLNSEQLEPPVNVQLSKPVFSVFDSIMKQTKEQEEIMKLKSNFGKSIQVTPYQRYLAILPLVEEEKRVEAERIAERNKKLRLCPEPVVPIKDELKDAQPEEDNDNNYNVPIKEMLKRKYEESVAKKALNSVNDENDNSPQAKRPKKALLTDENKIKFLNLPPTKKEQKQAATAAKAKPAMEQLDIQNEKDEDSDAPEEMPSTSQAAARVRMPAQQQLKKNGQKFKKNQKKNNKSQKHPQSSNNPVVANFDYKNVDFKKFQGGGRRAKPAELKPQFHGKGNANKANNKKFNKLFTFSNVKGNKK